MISNLEREMRSEEETDDEASGKAAAVLAASMVLVPLISIQEQLLRSNEKQFRGGLVFKARRRLYHSTLGRE